jgi:hypothetical protein
MREVNRRSKGMATMRKAREFGENLGYEIEQALHTRYKSDYFNMFDQIWIRNERLIFVQVKTNQSIGKMQKTFGFAPIKVHGFLKDIFISKEVR